MRSRLVLWGAYGRDVQVGSREDRDAQPLWPGVHRLLAGLDHAGERFRLEPWQEEAMRRLFRWPYGEARAVHFERVDGRFVRVGER